jgi:hypothetical protein
MLRALAAAAVLVAAGFGAAYAQGLTDENVLVGIPEGFVTGYDASQEGQEIHEFVPAGETVENWTRMITIEIFHGAQNADVEKFAGDVAGGWASACPQSTVTPLAKDTINGYPYVIWRYVCPMNPETGKPETMWMKAISGADAAYVIQYAERAVFDTAAEQPVADYFAGVSACDTRSPDHPCPKGM